MPSKRVRKSPDQRRGKKVKKGKPNISTRLERRDLKRRSLVDALCSILYAVERPPRASKRKEYSKTVKKRSK
jgi:hypothetical protein